jgi:hypothetical protein
MEFTDLELGSVAGGRFNQPTPCEGSGRLGFRAKIKRKAMVASTAITVRLRWRYLTRPAPPI